MEEDDISDAIYGDLGDFEFSEKLKEQNQEIASLTDRLRQSVVAITDLQNEVKNLKKENRKLLKNSSSLMQTARLELSRKQRDIALLQQKIENRIFRRPNNASIGVQTDSDVTKGPSFHCNATNDIVTNLEQMQPVVAKCTKNNHETVNTSNSIRNDLYKFRIPKKNQSERHENNIQSNNQQCAGNEKDADDSHDHQLPKKRPYSRRLDEKKSNDHVSSSDRNEIVGKKNSRSKDRRNDIKDDHRHSPVTTFSSGHRDYKKCNSDDQQWHKNNGRKRGRSSSDRLSKRHRSDSTSTSNQHRSRSKTSRHEEKRTNPKNLKSGKDSQIDDVKSRDDSISDLKEKDLEAMLIAQKKVLDEIDGNNTELQPGLKKKSSKERAKQKISNNVDPVNKSAHSVRNEDPVTTTKEAISESKNADEVKTTDPFVKQNNSSESDVCPKSLEVLPVVTENASCEEQNSKLLEEKSPKTMSPHVTNEVNCETSTQKMASFIAVDDSIDETSKTNEEHQPIKASTPKDLATIDSASFSLSRESHLPISTDLKAYAKDVQKTDQIQNDEKSNGEMDIDYELMERTSGETQTNLSCEKKAAELLVENSSDAMCSIVTSYNACEPLRTEINASFIAMEDINVSAGCVGENSLNSSHERHILSKSSEYTVQDVGNEIHIFLTKKRKKNRKLTTQPLI